jgi:hypothetical protein
VDATSGLTAIGFLQLVGNALGVDRVDSVAAGRLGISGMLSEDALEGRSWSVVVEDAHLASPEVWEEIRALSNHLGEAGGLSSLILAAHSELLGRMGTRELAVISGRISDHFHLPPLDVDECRALLGESALPGIESLDESTLQAIHRDARGNCGEILRLARRRLTSTPPLRDTPRPVGLTGRRDPAETPPGPHIENVEPAVPLISPPQPISAASDPIVARIDSELPVPTVRPEARSDRPLPLLPSRPPLRLEEGLIEVGWKGDETPLNAMAEAFEVAPRVPDPRAEAARLDESTSAASRLEHAEAAPLLDEDAEDEELAEEWVNDPYAALQAWAEWARSRGTESTGEAGPLVQADPTDPTRVDDRPSGPGSSVAPSSGTTIRAEPQHEFSPYGQLFSEARKSTRP